MRQLTVKYQGQCAKCGETLDIGKQAMYEKSMGIFCIGCEPKDVEDIRSFRQAKADRKADKYVEWAEKRKVEATARLNTYPEVRHDWAFITQPGRIPLRDRINKSDEIAFKSLNKADEMLERAESLRCVSVKGDKERARQKEREANLARFKVGDVVDTIMFGKGTILKFNKKTAKIGNTGISGTGTFNVPIHWLRPLSEV
jgi:hypothetical protein